MRKTITKSPVRKGIKTPIQVVQYSEDDEGLEELATDHTSATIVSKYNRMAVVDAQNATVQGLSKDEKVRLALMHMAENDTETRIRYDNQYKGKEWKDMIVAYYDSHLA